MTMRNSRFVTTAAVPLLALALSACNDERASVEPPRPAAAPVPANARLVLSDSAARAGDIVTIAAFASIPGDGAIGSFTARLLYDTLQLRIVDSDSPDDGALRAVNPVEGQYRVAGAHAQGLRDGLLFRFKARVTDPRGLRRIALAIDELHSTRFAELTQKLEVQDGRSELLLGMKGVKVQPPEQRQ